LTTTWDTLLVLDDGLGYSIGLWSISRIRGDVSTIIHRHAKANHPDLPDYDRANPVSTIVDLDMNNLYG
jgi:hypothetical protein